jgi:hypothetical protein
VFSIYLSQRFFAWKHLQKAAYDLEIMFRKPLLTGAVWGIFSCRKIEKHDGLLTKGKAKKIGKRAFSDFAESNNKEAAKAFNQNHIKKQIHIFQNTLVISKITESIDLIFEILIKKTFISWDCLTKYVVRGSLHLTYRQAGI